MQAAKLAGPATLAASRRAALRRPLLRRRHLRRAAVLARRVRGARRLPCCSGGRCRSRAARGRLPGAARRARALGRADDVPGRSRPTCSWAAFDRLLVYLASSPLLGLLATQVPRPARTIACRPRAPARARPRWALLGKVIPSLFPDGARVARLRNPIGYWNSLALVGRDRRAARRSGSLLGARPPQSVRAAGALLLYLAELVVVLTYSRAGIAVAALAALGWVCALARPARDRSPRWSVVDAGRRRSSRSGPSRGRRSPTTSSRTPTA